MPGETSSSCWLAMIGATSQQLRGSIFVAWFESLPEDTCDIARFLLVWIARSSMQGNCGSSKQSWFYAIGRSVQNLQLFGWSSKKNSNGNHGVCIPSHCGWVCNSQVPMLRPIQVWMLLLLHTVVGISVLSSELIRVFCISNWEKGRQFAWLFMYPLAFVP